LAEVIASGCQALERSYFALEIDQNMLEAKAQDITEEVWNVESMISVCMRDLDNENSFEPPNACVTDLHRLLSMSRDKCNQIAASLETNRFLADLEVEHG
ncbi:MAG TPA: hypothetical protein VK629_11975, partial [Steroidobacteraceae bacterium]|nr:hypothetical protein [Steroidobacteraceae bacterium]